MLLEQGQIPGQGDDILLNVTGREFEGGGQATECFGQGQGGLTFGGDAGAVGKEVSGLRGGKNGERQGFAESAPMGVAGGDYDVAGTREPGGERRRVHGVIEDQQPAGFAAQPADRGRGGVDILCVGIGDLGRAGEMGEIRNERGFLLGGDPPDGVVAGGVGMGVFTSQRRFADTTQTGQRLRKGGGVALG